jgi:hypothetical protein
MKIDKAGVHIEIHEDDNERAEVKIDDTGIKIESVKDSV